MECPICRGNISINLKADNVGDLKVEVRDEKTVFNVIKQSFIRYMRWKMEGELGYFMADPKPSIYQCYYDPEKEKFTLKPHSNCEYNYDIDITKVIGREAKIVGSFKLSNQGFDFYDIKSAVQLGSEDYKYWYHKHEAESLVGMSVY